MLKEYNSLLDLDHAFLLFIAVIIGALISSSSITSSVLIAGVSAAFIGISSFIINDLFDLEADRLNKRKDKPLAVGRINAKTAWVLFFLFLLVGLGFSAVINSACFIIALLFAFLSIAYAVRLKSIPFVGNLFIASSMAVPFIYGNLAVGVISATVLWLSMLAFLMGIGREIIGSIRDIEGDRKQGRKTLPIVIGLKKSSVIAALFILLAVILSFFPFFLVAEYYFDFYYLFFIIVTDLLLLLSVFKSLQLREFNLTRRLTLLAQFTGLAAFMLGVVF